MGPHLMYPTAHASAENLPSRPIAKKPNRELVLDLDYLASTYGLSEPYEFELGVRLEGNALIMRGYREEKTNA